jgi:hypothetical protein
MLEIRLLIRVEHGGGRLEGMSFGKRGVLRVGCSGGRCCDGDISLTTAMMRIGDWRLCGLHKKQGWRRSGYDVKCWKVSAFQGRKLVDSKP